MQVPSVTLSPKDVSMDFSELVRLFCLHPIKTLEQPIYVAPLGHWGW